jgi:hypothetical protein
MSSAILWSARWRTANSRWRSGARRHLAAAAWLERQTSPGADDHAETLAHHHATAVELARVGGDGRLVASALEPALASLQAAARRSMTTDAAAAARHFGCALELAPAGDPSRPRLLEGLGVALARTSQCSSAADALAASAAAAADAGDVRTAAVAHARRSGVLRLLGDEGHREAMAEAVALVRDEAPSPEQVQVMTLLAGYCCDELAEWQGGADAATAALTTAELLGMPPPVGALGYRGLARCRLGDPQGRTDIERALADGGGTSHDDQLVVERHYARSLYWTEGPVAALRRSGECLDTAARRGIRAATLGLPGTGWPLSVAG